jgi:ABC-type antimicrobial peptide transport system permease subunit
MVLLQGLSVSGSAAVLGVVLSLALGGLTRDMLSYVNPHDPAIHIAVFLLIFVVTGAACYVPAWRASMVDPNVTLRG